MLALFGGGAPRVARSRVGERAGGFCVGRPFGLVLRRLFGSRLVGVDSVGNRYFERRGRRFVLYGGSDASGDMIDPLWHGWLHYTERHPPTPPPTASKRTD